MKIELRAGKISGDGDITGTVSILSDAGDLVFEDVINLSKSTKREAFAAIVAVKVNVDRSRVLDQLLGLLEDQRKILLTPTPSPNGSEPYEATTGLFPRTDSGNAELFADMHNDKLKFDHRQGRWARWTGHFWDTDNQQKVVQMAKTAARARYVNAVEIIDPRARGSEAQWAIGSESRAKIDSALYLAQSEPRVALKGDEWDQNPMLLATPSGVVDLRTGKLNDGRQEDYLTQHTDIPYVSDAKCPRWLRFLDEVFGGRIELIDYIHRAVGYSITGLTNQQCWFLAYGKGANGKSTFLAMLAHVLGGYAQALPFDTLSISDRPAIPNDLAALVGVRFVTTIESGESRRLNEPRIKALSGEDTIRARFLRAEFFDFKPKLKLWLATNHKPIVRDQSHGFWRRVRLIPFDQSFPTNDSLTEELMAEAEGILKWAVDGALKWQQDGLEPPNDVLMATSRYRDDEDGLMGFYTETCVAGEGYEVRAKPLYNAYCDWAVENQLKPRETLSNQLFGRIASERFNKVHRKTGSYYLGIGLRTDYPVAGDGDDGFLSDPGLAGKCLEPRGVTLDINNIRHPGIKKPSPFKDSDQKRADLWAKMKAESDKW